MKRWGRYFETECGGEAIINYGETQSGTWSRRTSLSPTVWGHLRAFAWNLEPRSSWRAGSGVGFFVGEDRIGQARRLKSWRPRPLPLVCLSPSLRGGLGYWCLGVLVGSTDLVSCVRLRCSAR